MGGGGRRMRMLVWVGSVLECLVDSLDIEYRWRLGMIALQSTFVQPNMRACGFDTKSLPLQRPFTLTPTQNRKILLSKRIVNLLAYTSTWCIKLGFNTMFCLAGDARDRAPFTDPTHTGSIGPL